MKTSPGLCKATSNDKRLNRSMVKFIDTRDPNYADIGELNSKMEYIKKELNISVKQIDYDFNFDYMAGHFNTIFCFEVLEYLQNPLFFMNQIKKILNDNGTLYLSSPSRPRFLWTKHHFFEMDRKHLYKWILEPLDFKIVRKKKIRINHHWTFYLSGFRLFFRIFFNYTNIYEIKHL